MRNVPLAERRADLQLLEHRIRAHRLDCDRKDCDEMREMHAEAKQIRDELRHWFDPPPDAPTLFDGPGVA